MPPIWVPAFAVRAIHADLLTEHGGLSGPPREGSLEAALARPQHLFSYANPPASLHQLAAAYAFALARGHCFPDGNKRIALAVLDVFLQLNGEELAVSEPEAVVVTRSLASGEISEDALADWIKKNSKPL